jgi:hypothetical protein
MFPGLVDREYGASGKQFAANMMTYHDPTNQSPEYEKERKRDGRYKGRQWFQLELIDVNIR